MDSNRLIPFHWIILCVCLACGGVLLFAFDSFASIWDDEAYQAICVRRYSESPLGILTFFIGHVWSDIFGFSLLNLRVLAEVETLLAVGVASAYLYRLSRSPLLTGVAFLLGCILMKACAFPIYNWDSGIYLFNSIAICLMVSACAKPGIVKYGLLGATIGVITLGRVPSGILLPLAMIVAVWANRYNDSNFNSFKATGSIFLGWLAAMVILTTIMAGSPSRYISLFTSDHIISGHSPLENGSELFQRINFIVTKSAFCWFPGLCCMLLALLFSKLKNRMAQAIFLFMLIAFCCLISYRYTHYNLEMPLLLGGDGIIGIGLLLAYPLYALFNDSKSKNMVIMQLYGIGAVYFSMMFGSDAFIERVTAGFSIPVIIGLIWQLRIQPLRSYIRYFSGVTIIVFAFMLAVNILCVTRYMDRHGYETSMEPAAGIKTQTDWERTMRESREAIEFLKSRNTDYAVMVHHQYFELVFGPDRGLSFQEYSADLYRKEVWLKHKDEVMRRVDAFVYPVSAGRIIDSEVLEDMRRQGYNDSVRIGEAVVIYRDGYRK